MNPKFWQKRWQDKRIGFNQSEVNPLLVRYFSHLNVPANSRVFVPLSGKSIDMIWLAAQGYDVVGVELVEIAVQAFFAEQNISPTVHQLADNPAIKCYQGQLFGQEVKIWIADIFALSANEIGHVDAVYDKAALIALPSDMRLKYSEQVRKLGGNVSNKIAPQLLLTLNYDQSKKEGPPFSISSEQIQHYYGAHYHISELAGEPTFIRSALELKVTEHVWLLGTK